MTTKSRSSLFFALVLGLALIPSTRAHAGKREVDAINAQLTTAGKNIASATDTELTNAVMAVLTSTSYLSYDPGVVVGEALKGAKAATNIGSSLSTAVIQGFTNTPNTGLFPKILGNVEKFVGVSGSTAATSTGANPTQIPDFTAQFITLRALSSSSGDRNTEAIAIAKNATKSTTAIGAIIGARTLNGDLTDDASLVGAANQAIFDPKLSKAAQQITSYVGAAATNAAQFAFEVVRSNANTKYIVQIATGTTSTHAGDASKIINALFANDGTSDNVSSAVYQATVKNATKLASGVANVADLEQISLLADQFGKRVGVPDPTPGSTKIVGIKQSNVNALAKGLITAIATRAYNVGDVASNIRYNKLDEVGEVGVYLLNAIKGLPVFTTNTSANAKQAPSLIIGMMKTIVKASLKIYNLQAAIANPKKPLVSDPAFQATIAEDLAGGIALTLRELESVMDPTIYGKIFAALIDPGIGKKIAGSSKTLFSIDGGPQKTIAQQVTDALNAVLTDSAATSTLDQKYKKYENGTVLTYATGPYDEAGGRGMITEPETDIRNH